MLVLMWMLLPFTPCLSFLAIIAIITIITITIVAIAIIVIAIIVIAITPPIAPLPVAILLPFSGLSAAAMSAPVLAGWCGV